MKNTEHVYIEAGFKFERARTPGSTQAAAQTIRRLIESEHIDDQADARRLIELGRQEARVTL